MLKHKHPMKESEKLHLQEIESLQNSLREREKYVAELENRLRALWDKIEYERLVSEIERENKRLKEQNKRQNEAIDSLREMYAKEGKP
jgi:hypothetical protein